ncbi:hypothetical protein BMF94_0401 [Rhodotorula taiwanensis]|uniref:Dienelactone hydrolase domain-containing protein n=1 Tax=Rhodotorula taiwanensis TaxID=741276 RepID=A0A2S5BHF3_9BASI|nr:hypothetical protein BMF94_0401 [Rhodotorula taiwanensis]
MARAASFRFVDLKPNQQRPFALQLAAAIGRDTLQSLLQGSNSMSSSHAQPYSTCSACFEGSRLEGEPKGMMSYERMGGLQYYWAEGSARQRHSPRKAIVLGTDVFGLGLPNPKIMADLFASQTGLDVFVPDFFNGEYMPQSELKPPGGGGPTPAAQEWRKKYSIDAVRPGVEAFCRALKSDEIGFSRIGFVGYCYGGILAVLLASQDGPVDASVCAHPGKLDLADWERVREPLALVLAEKDHIFDEQKPQALSILDNLAENKNVPIRVYSDHPGTTHGFGCRPDLEDEAVRKAWDKAALETVAWFAEHL